ncbi:hypothetical protein [Aquipseudomonas alcaligenes]|uniref:Uncharacterized protein n=1 Tax=Aquipseudomonas alcaligenes TaxID=43263 RepID=A0AA37CIK0_AQUAC|nr:hypothetical protein [Pseudomonas alcaligenes]BCR26233.1 hypothetical protein KAM426_37600 [Pseudomonas alcaligenes]GIZ68777.1 hypothetical protein KAM428_38620 [Pseudomonas alcaligenes]GIZ73161.1 hypothetical protein KAM429_39220 [Pseudomonas alcaligenes]GIZ77522.1 hypothetical protein KAM430_39310 [Pseudomonas alcaligenes]GIZ81831.1 hypothetical protein KAM432_38790 [Pseudomonas alcaligenes]
MSNVIPVNTHDLYNTISHEHLDGLVSKAIGEFPAAGLNLLECADGRWFVEVDYGSAFDHLAGVSRPTITPYTEPVFFQSEAEALRFAYTCIKQVYPELENKDLSEYYSDEIDV